MSSFKIYHQNQGEKFFTEIFNQELANKKMLVHFHGFPGNNRLKELIPILKDNEISVAEANFRGDPNCEGHFSFLGSISDSKIILNDLKNKFPSSQIIPLGFSVGGFYLLNALPTINFISKIILLAPLVNCKLLLNQSLFKKLWPLAKQTLKLKTEDFYQKEVQQCLKNCHIDHLIKTHSQELDLIASENDNIIPKEDLLHFYKNISTPKKFFNLKNAKHNPIQNLPDLAKIIQKNFQV